MNLTDFTKSENVSNFHTVCISATWAHFCCNFTNYFNYCGSVRKSFRPQNRQKNPLKMWRYVQVQNVTMKQSKMTSFLQNHVGFAQLAKTILLCNFPIFATKILFV